MARWNGTDWTTEPSPSPPGPAYSRLGAVSCLSATECAAAGGSSAGSLVERWNGTSWSLDSPQPGGYGPLTGLSCVSANDCIAIGGPAYDALVKHWDGTRWVPQATPAPPTGFYRSVSGVSCTSATACTVVGFDTSEFTGGPVNVVSMRWDGTAWTEQQPPEPAQSQAFRAVSCASAADCTAVGSQQRDPNAPSASLVEHWNGQSWSVDPSLNPSGATGIALNGVSCASATACTAVGSSSAGALALRWDGKSWALQAVPNPRGATGGALNGVSCVAAADCVAVGASSVGTLSEHWDGSSWSIEASRNPLGATGSSLLAVSCVSVSDCFAVGGSSAGVLVERWSGVPPPVASIRGRVGTLGARLNLTFSCTGESGQRCHGTVTVRTVETFSRGGRRVIGLQARRPRTGRSATVTVARLRVSAPAGSSRSLWIGLNPTGQKLRARFMVLPATVTATSVNAGHTRTIRTAEVIFRPDPPKLRVAGVQTSYTTVILMLVCRGLTRQVCAGTASVTTFENHSPGGRITGLSRRRSGAGTRVTVATRRWRLAAGRTLRIDIRLSRGGHQLLSRFSRIPAMLSVMPIYNGYALRSADAPVLLRR